jgi:hypothetical protein
MRRTLALVAAAALALTALGVALPSSAGATDERVQTLRERLYLLDGYLEHFANVHYNYYPRSSEVRKGGIRAPLWPRNPWTGAAMHSGGDSGDYTYVLARDRLSYDLIGHYPGGTVTVHGAVPQTRKMQNDHRTIEGAELIQRFIEQWIRSHGGVAPKPAQVAADGAVGKQGGIAWWPHDPWTHKPIARGRGWSEFSYAVDAQTGRYRLTMHFSRGGTRTYRGPKDWSASPRLIWTLGVLTWCKP